MAVKMTNLRCIKTFFVITVSLFLFSFQTLASEQFKELTVAVSKISYPHHYEDANGNADGLFVDFWRLWAEKQGVDITFETLDWVDTVQQVKDGDIDIHAGLTIDKGRRDFFKFTPSFFRNTTYFYIHRDYLTVDSISQLRPYTIGVIKGFSHVTRLRKKLPFLSLREYETRYDLYDAAVQGEVIAFIDTDKVSIKYDDYQTVNSLFPPYKRVKFDDSAFASAVAIENEDLFYFIQQGMLKITREERKTLERKWLGLENDRDTLLIAFSENYAPFTDIGADGKPQGLLIDIWRQWSEFSGIDIDFIKGDLRTSVEDIKENRADVHIGFPESHAFTSGLQIADQVYQSRSQFFVSNEYPDIKSVKQLDGMPVGVYESAPYLDELIQQYPDIIFKTYLRLDQMMTAARDNEIVAMVGAVENMLRSVADYKLKQSYHLLKKPVFEPKLYALVHIENNTLAARVKEGFQQIPIENLVEIENKWLAQRNLSYFHQKSRRVPLTPKQQNWVFNHENIKVGFLKNWPPVESINEFGDFEGINPDFFDLISQRTGVDFSFVPFDDWQSMYQAIKDKEIDVIGSADKSVERQAFLSFTEPYWQVPWVIFHPKALGNFLKLSDYQDHKLAVIEGYQVSEQIRVQYPTIELVIVKSLEQAYQLLQAGKVMGIVETMEPATELLKRESLITMTISTIEGFKLEEDHFAIRNDWPELLSIFNQALLSITEQERQIINDKWFDVEINTGLDKSTVFKVAAQVGIFASIIIAIIVFWNRRLYLEIKQRKSLEAKMKHMATHDELTGLANRSLLAEKIQSNLNLHQRQHLHLAVLFIDLDGFKNINDTYGHDVGDELLVELAQRLKTCVRQSDTVARFGGDEFVLLLTGLNAKNEASHIAEKVLRTTRKPVDLSAATVSVGCSIGIATFPDDGKDAIELLKVADTLMYQVKSQGKNFYLFN